jgi:hypothetical protein
VFNALIAPVAFSSVVEYPLVIVLACLFLPGAFLGRVLRRGEERDGHPRDAATSWVLDLGLPLVLGAAIMLLGWVIDAVVEPAWSSSVWQALIGLAAGLCLYFAYSANRPIRFGLGIAALLIAGTILSGTGEGLIFEDRDFFGVRKVVEDTSSMGTEENPYHVLSHGDTTHGAEFLDGSTPPEPITYYARTGPVGQLFDALPNEDVKSRVALLGLGTGTMACYNAPGRQMTFYEIDPLVETLARDTNLFTYLSDCPGESNVVLGDARLSLRNAPDGEYGVIVGDAFSSDAIPVHLVTREAIDLYLSKLRSDGVLAMHISNRHLELEPVFGDLAQDRGLVCYSQFDVNTEGTPGKFPSHWVVMARQPSDLGNVPGDGRWQPCSTTSDPSSDVWTDDFSNLLSTFNWG